MKERLLYIITLSLIILLNVNTISYAHSGRTDSSGGHHDYRNTSGLGPYHYHCGGYPAHLHNNGYCPYTTPRSSISVSNLPSRMNAGETKSFSYKLGANGDYVYWSSSDTSVVRVNGDGEIQAVSPGTATITAEMRTTSREFKITVLAVPATKISTKINSKKMKIGENQKIICSVSPENATYKGLIFKTSNPKVAEVDEYGNITAVGIGKATISVSQPESKIVSKLNINVPKIYPDKIKIVFSKKEVEITASPTVDISISPADATEKKYTLSSSDENILKISQNGKITPVGLGTATIIAETTNEKIAKKEITIYQIPEESLVLTLKNEPSFSLFGLKFYDYRDDFEIKSQVYPENATYKDVSLSSSDVELEDTCFFLNGKGTYTINGITKNGIESSITLKAYNIDMLKAEFVIVCIITLFTLIAITGIIYKKKHSSNEDNI